MLAFPGIFRGALDVRASDINEEMKLAAAKAIASCVSDEELTAEYIMPMAFDKKGHPHGRGRGRAGGARQRRGAHLMPKSVSA